MKSKVLAYDRYDGLNNNEGSTIKFVLNKDKCQVDILIDKRFEGHHIHIQVPSLNEYHFIPNSVLKTATLIRTHEFKVDGVIKVLFLSPNNEPTWAAIINTTSLEVLNKSEFFQIGLYKAKIERNVSQISDSLLYKLIENIRSINSNWTMLTNDLSLISEAEARKIPIPELKNRRRIHSHVADNDINGESYFKGGRIVASQFIKIAQVYGILSKNNILTLDWGVGCGRLARHLPYQCRSNFLGIDVDPINIDWCKKNMGFGSYNAVDPYEREKISSSQFDLIYSYSVMTHLVDSDQEFWLKKLIEVLSPNGLMILSVHGIHHACGYEWATDPNIFTNFIDNGSIRGRSQNPDIADVTPENYYTDVSNTAFSIIERWSKIARVVDIIPNGVGSHDAIVLRRK